MNTNYTDHIDLNEFAERMLPPSLRENHTAVRLFINAWDAGLIDYHFELDTWITGPELTRPALAYWCQRASTFLGLDKGFHRTNWKLFDEVFGGSNPLKASLHSFLDRKTNPHYREIVDDFFNNQNGDNDAYSRVLNNSIT